MLKIKWHEKLTLTDKILRTGACLFASTIFSILIVDMWFLFNETEPKFNFFNVVLFFTIFYFLFKKIRVLPPPDKNVTCPKSEPHLLSDINNPSNPFAYTTPGGIGYKPIETGLENINRNNPFSDLDNYNNRF